MSLELILDVLLSALFIVIYNSDQQLTPAYACASSGGPLFGGHEEFYRTRMVAPEDYESATHLVTSDDTWVADPMDTPLDAELVAIEAAIDMAYEQMDAEIEASEAALAISIETKIDLLCPEGSDADAVVAMLTQFAATPYTKTRAAKVVELRLLTESMFDGPIAGKKAELAEQALCAFANRGISQYSIGGLTFVPSDDDLTVRVVV